LTGDLDADKETLSLPACDRVDNEDPEPYCGCAENHDNNSTMAPEEQDDVPRRGVRKTSDAGLTGSHDSDRHVPAVVATATPDGHNKIVLSLHAIACWSMGEVRFQFDSSFIGPSAIEEFSLLAQIRDSHKKTADGQDVYPPLSVFGHADPVGKDDYNKQLSGRRARAVYAALVRDTKAWEDLYSNPFAGDHWGLQSLQVMLGAVGEYAGIPTGTLDSDTRTAVESFQRSEGLAVDGDPGPKTRARLFERYMDHLCGDGLKLSKTEDFLARGTDSGGKGDYQGCGEFNPVLMFSSTEKEQLDQPDREADRNAQNAPNRRILALLFPPGESVDPAIWPCPRAKEGPARCKDRFWSDAAQRRSFQADRRVYEKTHDTFACRFYDVLNDRSPCERALAVLRLRLHDAVGRRAPGAQYQLEYAGRTKHGRADSEGFVTDVLDPDADTCVVRWATARTESSVVASDPTASDAEADPASPENLSHELSVFVQMPDLGTDEGLKRRLHNLGYLAERDVESNLRAFQSHHGLEITGQADDATNTRLRSIYGNASDVPTPPGVASPVSAPDTEQRT
jgi:outer membrane protein OmpA-like peptidoglycan-associated protein